ncbi:predicted protein [Paecilomyces variotii No. 5]|uniref:Coenzyme Q-binding protein COQ10 START domain-containing protein n=1 Tax=Byssochlamys spectabilis (strain No. 5 / NBRC 109023) TaxID=1356009 RepID=V5FYL1_BYSSN|nr:predicted protein [Paecilomyces variotii No. 5]
MPTASERDLSSQSTPTIPSSKAILHISASTRVKAPISRIWDTLINTSTWPEWNSFISRVTIRDQPHYGSSADPATATSSSHPDESNGHNKVNVTNNNRLSPIFVLGTRASFHAVMNPKKPENTTEVPLVITDFKPPPDALSETGGRIARIVWSSDHGSGLKGSLSSWLLHAERVHQIEELDEEGESFAEVRTWEAQKGLLAYVVKYLYGSFLQAAFGRWVDELKGFIEREIER